MQRKAWQWCKTTASAIPLTGIDVKQEDHQVALANQDSVIENPEMAKIRRELAKLTPEGVAQLVMELRVALAELRAENEALWSDGAKL